MTRQPLPFLFVFLFISTVSGYFSQPDLLTTIPFKEGLAYVKRGQSIILFGGESNTAQYTNDLNQLTQTPTGYTWSSLPQQNTPPATAYAQGAISPDGSTLTVLGGITNATKNQVYPLQVYQYNFNTTTWSAQRNPNNASTNTAPLNRWLFSATTDPSNGRVYIYGGVVNETAIFSDLWLFDPSTMGFTSIAAPNIRRYGHTASLTSNGKLVFLGGVMVSATYDQNILAPMNQIQIFDTTSNQWLTSNATAAPGNVLPSPRAHHSAVLINGTHILMFGGNNNAAARQRASINSVYMLDTTTWTWTSPSIGGILPSRRAYAVAEMLDNRYATIVFGGAGTILYNDINTLDTFTNSWLQSFTNTGSSDYYGLSTGVIVGVAVACVIIFVIICVLLWKFGRYLRWLVMRIHADIWKPRSGEPLWAETTRICFQILLLFIFFIFLAFVVRQAVNSPNVTQTIEVPAASVDVPDVRFCFDGYPTYPDPADPRNPGVVCQTDVGYSCTSFVKTLDMSIFRPNFADQLGAVNCYLFRSDAYFQMAGTSGANNGSRLIFTLYGDTTITSGRVHVSAFPKQMDPNAKIYNINDGIPVLMDRDNVLNWQNAELNDMQTTNVFTVAPYTYSAMSYTLSDHQYLQDVGWNYVGFLPSTNSTPEITTNFRSESANPTYNLSHSDIGVIALTPDSYVKTTLREVKMYTLLNALGFVGGIFGLLIALQAWLFGYRPKSPWGVVHRWSVGDMKRSLLRGLQSKFKTTDGAGIPLVHPVHKRFSVTDFNNVANETESQRISRVEERMQVMELLFKAYYVDDEVFRSLDNASKTELGALHRRHRNIADDDTGGIIINPALSDSVPLYSNNVATEKLDVNSPPKGARTTKSGDYELVERQDTASNTSSHSADHHDNHSPPKNYI